MSFKYSDVVVQNISNCFLCVENVWKTHPVLFYGKCESGIIMECGSDLWGYKTHTDV